jgi:hypothetical protein
MVPVTPEELRGDTRIDWTALGLPEADPDIALEEEIAVAWAYVEEKTGRDLDTLTDGTNLASLARRAVKLRVVQQAIQGQGSFITREIDRQIKSFSVPGYSETRESGSTLDLRNFPNGYFNEWPILNDLLWLLATDEKRDEAQASTDDEDPPASAITAVGWTGWTRWSGDGFFYG